MSYDLDTPDRDLLAWANDAQHLLQKLMDHQLPDELQLEVSLLLKQASLVTPFADGCGSVTSSTSTELGSTYSHGMPADRQVQEPPAQSSQPAPQLPGSRRSSFSNYQTAEEFPDAQCKQRSSSVSSCNRASLFKEATPFPQTNCKPNIISSRPLTRDDGSTQSQVKGSAHEAQSPPTMPLNKHTVPNSSRLEQPKGKPLVAKKPLLPRKPNKRGFPLHSANESSDSTNTHEGDTDSHFPSLLAMNQPSETSNNAELDGKVCCPSLAAEPNSKGFQENSDLPPEGQSILSKQHSLSQSWGMDGASLSDSHSNTSTGSTPANNDDGESVYMEIGPCNQSSVQVLTTDKPVASTMTVATSSTNINKPAGSSRSLATAVPPVKCQQSSDYELWQLYEDQPSSRQRQSLDQVHSPDDGSKPPEPIREDNPNKERMGSSDAYDSATQSGKSSGSNSTVDSMYLDVGNLPEHTINEQEPVDQAESLYECMSSFPKQAESSDKVKTALVVAQDQSPALAVTSGSPNAEDVYEEMSSVHQATAASQPRSSSLGIGATTMTKAGPENVACSQSEDYNTDENAYMDVAEISSFSKTPQLVGDVPASFPVLNSVVVSSKSHSGSESQTKADQESVSDSKEDGVYEDMVSARQVRQQLNAKGADNRSAQTVLLSPRFRKKDMMHGNKHEKSALVKNSDIDAAKSSQSANQVGNSSKKSDCATEADKKRTPVASLMQDATLGGFLMKRGKSNSKWNQRWCVLKGNDMYYAHRQTDKDTSRISLIGYEVEATPAIHQFAFRLLHASQRPYFFRAFDSIGFKSWFSALEKVMEPEADLCTQPTKSLASFLRKSSPNMPKLPAPSTLAMKSYEGMFNKRALLPPTNL